MTDARATWPVITQDTGFDNVLTGKACSPSGIDDVLAVGGRYRERLRGPLPQRARKLAAECFEAARAISSLMERPGARLIGALQACATGHAGGRTCQPCNTMRVT